MDLDNVKMLWSNYSPMLVIAILLFLPTGIYYIMKSNSYMIPSFISMLAIKNWFQGVFAVGAGVGLGFLINKKYSD